MRYMGINATCRASIYIYNTKEDIDMLIKQSRKPTICLQNGGNTMDL